MKKISLTTNHKYAIGFFLLMIGVFFFLGVHTVFTRDPFGLHFIRQTDSIAFASRYYETGFNFFKPSLYHLQSIEGNGVCEFPIFYYLTAVLFTVFGKHFFILKLMHFVVANFGVFSIYKLSFRILKNQLFAFGIGLFLFTSTVFNYYSLNYLPDIAALGFMFMGWDYYFRHLEFGSNKFLKSSFIFFTLGGLLKVTYMISPLAIIGYWVLLSVQKRQSGGIKLGFRYAIICVGVVLLWNFYMYYYNSLYNCIYFTTAAMPIWGLDYKAVNSVWQYINDYWYSRYFAHSSFHILALIIPFQLIFIKKKSQPLFGVSMLLAVGGICYFLLFYRQFKDHDYYFMALFPCVILLLLNALKTFQRLVDNQKIHIGVGVLFLVLVMLGINYSRQKLEERYDVEPDQFSIASTVVRNQLEDLNELNISHDSRFIIVPESSLNGSLLYLEKQGWNIKTLKELTASKISSLKQRGANYMLIIGDSTITNQQQFEDYEKVYMKDKITLYSIN